ncbi:probable methenyltetrahydrofolate cyclohydrolase [Natronomonas pharaonis DSM 2160]|uniref:Methenyltetrahydromethanopterin cyclohydrolase n=1 Tax=Natronomonas pharaonis (strain ATCC 35678 / DSM 2160 / CIP 103997 / JCM 8858 / NBRC 14720 / NCIMB 2260 / Gabara) TaxID=348780 RepID=A0A1U7EWF4_NATPD|nr:methenyltetrahydromethanopterin cyclohydrolase [Natronomonas pharaonis]CAI49408.1 probable methenyltetrahydrofolate cyclohydrolase [Natronomonas pharaonis DSM 2160]
MESLNRMAVELVDEAVDFADELAIEIEELDNGAMVCDFGVEATGGIEAGLLLTEIQTGGLATVQTTVGEVADAPLTHVEVSSDHPGIAFLAAQKAGWEISVDGFEGLGSGPARALVAEEEEHQRLGYRDAADFAVLAIESDRLPTEAVAEQVAERAGVPTSSVFLPTFSTASITGSVALAARAGELAAFRLSELGYDPLDMLSATASAPVAPIAGDDETAMARTNDALAYGGRVHLTVDSDFERLSEATSTASDEFGTPFADIFESHEWDFQDLPVEVFAPAQVTFDVAGGGLDVVGELNEELLAESFGIESA